MEDEHVNDELCVAKSFSFKRRTIAAIRARATALGTSMSSYVAAAVERDLERGLDQSPSPGPAKVERSLARGIVVEFDLDDD
jgi:hypothetical protein